MRIAFMSTCLEPGKDGVGDYTWDLASACAALGHDCSLIALNDRHVTSPLEETRDATVTPLDILRLPAGQPLPDRMRHARSWLTDREPEWISLQFVPYGFHPKGLVTGLRSRLEPLVQGRSVHVMLHELWIGSEPAAALRRRLVGWVQRQAILDLLRNLEPRIVQTTNPVYQQMLGEHGVTSSRLPLCGSIPVAPDADPYWLDDELIAAGVPEETARGHDRTWRFGLFGSIHPDWSPESLLTDLASAAAATGRLPILVSVGRQGPGATLWNDMRTRFGDRIGFAALGERPRSEVSALLQSVDFGIATTPWQIIGKSATAAAMLDHGLPVIVSRDDVKVLKGDQLDTGETLLYRLDEHLPQWLANARKQVPQHRLGEMAQRFLNGLQQAAPAMR